MGEPSWPFQQDLPLVPPRHAATGRRKCQGRSSLRRLMVAYRHWQQMHAQKRGHNRIVSKKRKLSSDIYLLLSCHKICSDQERMKGGISTHVYPGTTILGKNEDFTNSLRAKLRAKA